MEEGVWVVGESIRDTWGGSLNYIHMVAAIGSGSRTKVESTGRVVVPGESNKGGLVDIAQLASRENGMGSKIVGHVVEAMVGRLGRVGVPGLEMVEGEFNKWEKLAPEVERKGNVNGSEGSNNVIFRSADISFGKVGSMVVGGNVLDSTGRGRRTEESAGFRGGFVV